MSENRYSYSIVVIDGFEPILNGEMHTNFQVSATLSKKVLIFSKRPIFQLFTEILLRLQNFKDFRIIFRVFRFFNSTIISQKSRLIFEIVLFSKLWTSILGFNPEKRKEVPWKFKMTCVYIIKESESRGIYTLYSSKLFRGGVHTVGWTVRKLILISNIHIPNFFKEMKNTQN